MKKRVLSLLLCVLIALPSFTGSLSVANAASSDIVYNMAADTEIQSKAVSTTFAGVTWLQNSGSPTLTIVDNAGAKAISVTNRTQDWYSIDLKNLSSVPTLPVGYNYAIKVTGRTTAGAKMKLAQPASPYGTHVSQVVGAEGTFSLKATFTYAQLQTEGSVRIQSETPAEGTFYDFFIDSIVIAKTTVAYSMANDSQISIGASFEGTTWLERAGPPILTVVDNAGAKAISVTGRSEDWHSVDLKNLDTLHDEFEYTIKVTGRADPGAKMKLSQPASPYGTHASQVAGAEGTFSLEKTFTYAQLQTEKKVRIQSEGSAGNFFIDSIVITQTAVPGGATPPPPDGAATEDIAITFNAADQVLWSGAFAVNNTTNVALQWVSDFGKDDTYALKGTHQSASTDYNAANNAIRLTFAEPLAKNAIYTISYSVFVPTAGNEGKGTLVGPGIVLSNGYAGSTGVTKFPATPGNIVPGEWKNVNVTTPADGLSETLKSIDFRFVVNDGPNHPDVWYIDNISIKQQLIDLGDTKPDYKDYRALKDVYKDYFLIGTASGNSNMTGDKLDIIKYHFNTFTPENEMKPNQVQNVQGIFTYGTLDTQLAKLPLDFKLIGHTLAWHSQTPAWMWGTPTPLTKEQAMANMDAHIESVLNRYGASLYSIDVVNEAMADDRKNADWRLNLRDNEGWYLAMGSEWVEHAFVKAAEVVDSHPGWNVKLYYNDYNLDYTDKANSVYKMVKYINENNTRANGKPLIEGIGMQGHYNQNTSPANVESSINLFSTLPGVAISVTELDITYLNSGSLTEQQAKSQAVKYAQLFELYKKNAAGPANEGKGRIERVTFWGTNDADSWRAASLPLLFDKHLRAKEAFKAVLDPEGYLSKVIPPAGQTYDKYPALKDVYEDYFTTGIFGSGETNALIHNFAAYAPGNEMKPDSTQSVKGTFTYIAADNAFDNLLSKNPGMLFYGHTLAWHSQSPTWMWDAPPARYEQPGTYDAVTALANLNNHIENVLGYYGGRLKGVDVVNEAIGTVNKDDPENWKAALAKGEGWYMALGSEWVEKAFLKAAQVVDSHPEWDCKLIYNDFGLDSLNKAKAVYAMVRDINAKHSTTRPNGKPLIEVIGMQEHDNFITKASDVENAIKLFATLPGVSVNITEMDIGCPPVGTLTPENENNQAMKYAELFQIFKKYAVGPGNKTNNPKVIDRVSICGVRDATTGWRAGEFALLFTSAGLAKEALVAVLDPDAYLASHEYIEPETEPETKPVEGVHVYDMGKGDGYSGANIILGNDASQWPWSIADADGKVAFTPEKEATYRLTFNYTSTGTSSIRVRWVKDNSNGGYTTADGAIVNNHQRSASQVATVIPAYFNSGMVNGGSYTLTTEIKLDGSQPANGLIGNIAIRGGGGGSAFAINWIKVEKVGTGGASDELLVNWPEGIKAPIAYTATANGTANVLSTTSVALVFEKSVPGLTTSDITITDGTASVTKGALTAVAGTDDKQYNLAISGVTMEGNIKLKINKDGVDNTVKTVDVHKAGAITYTATANGTANIADSTSIALVFDKPVPGLVVGDIAVTAGTASATKGALTAVAGSDNTKYNLAISGVTTGGTINLKITKDGVDNAVKTVDVYKGPITFTVANVGGTAFVRDSTAIRLTFNAAVSDLSVDSIILSPGTPAAVSNYATSTAQKGSLTKVSDTVYELALTGITKTGTLGVRINKTGVETNQKNVIVNAKVVKTALQPIPPRTYFPQNITNLPKSPGLNDLFKFLDPTAGTNGQVETKADWSVRKDELKDLIQYYYYGRKYPTLKSAITVNAQTNQVNVTINDNGRTVTASLGTVTVPTGTAPEGGWPVIIAFGFGQTAMATQNGYAVISVSNWGGSRTGNYYNLYPFNPYEYDFNTGSIMTAAWTVSRIIDAMEISAQANGGMNQWKINPYKSLTTGVSISGKYALMAAAMDDRVGGAAPVDCGQSGASSFRYTAEGKLFYYNSPADSIYRRNQKGLNSIQYSGESFWMGLGTAAGFHQQTDMDYLPFDAHAVEALMAPRPLIAFTSDNNFDWTTPPSSISAMSAAKEVYEFLGSGDNIAVRTRDGAHAIQDRDVPFMIAIMDKEFSGKPLEVRDLYPNSNPPSYGIGSYNKISDMTIYPYDIDSSYIRWSRPGKYTLWTENEIVTEGIPATIKVHSDALMVRLTILDADNKPTSATWMAGVKNGTAVFNLKAEQVKIGRYEITTVGADKDSKTVYFQGIDAATALRHGTARNDNGAAVMYGFTSKINKDLVEVYADGNKLTQSLQEDTEQAWILNYGVTTNPNENNRILNTAFNVITLKKLQMEALAGYTFEISIDKSKLANNQQTVSWNASEAVQKIGPQPNWPPYPNSTADKNNPSALRPLKPATTTSFSAITTFSLNNTVDLAAGGKLKLTFSEPMYKDDFGIGFDFSDDFALAWAADGKSVEVTFNDVTKAKGEKCNLYIMRLSDAVGNMIAAPIQHSFTLLSKPADTTPTTPGNNGPVNGPAIVTPPQSQQGNSVITIETRPVLGSNGNATTNISTDLLNTAFEKAVTGADGTKTVAINIVPVAGASGYTQELPRGALAGAAADRNLEIRTAVGTVTVPGNMLNNVTGNASDAVALTIAKADTSSLREEERLLIGNRPVIDLSISVNGKTTAWNNPDAPVTISIGYTPTADELKDPEHIVVWYIDGQGNVIPVPNGRYDAATGKVIFNVTHFSKYAVASVYTTFTDIGKFAWAKKQIEVLASKGIITGISEDGKTFGPSTNITRADFITLLVRTLELNAKVDSNFSDVKKGKHYYNAVGVAKKLGITDGVGNDLFAPEKSITRQDMIVLTEKALKLAGKKLATAGASDLGSFTDASQVAGYAQQSVALLVKNGIINGSGNRLNPKGMATRAEVAVIMYSVYNK